MTLDELTKRIEKLERRNRISGWVIFGLGLVALFFTFYSIRYPVLQDVKLELHHFLGPWAGSLIGVAIGSWEGNSEMKLLKEYLDKKTSHL